MNKLLKRYFAVTGPVHAMVNAAAGVVMIFSIVWAVHVWTRPVLDEPVEDASSVARRSAAEEASVPGEKDYSILDAKDPFGPLRVKAAAKPKPVAPTVVALLPPPPPPPPPPKPVPKFVLVGTVLLGRDSTAIITYPGGARESYKTGAVVEGFVIKQIKSDSVFLERDGQTIRVFITEPQGALR